MCNLKITSLLCLLPTGAGLLKSLSPKRESQSAAEDQTKRREKRDKKRGRDSDGKWSTSGRAETEEEQKRKRRKSAGKDVGQINL